MLSNNQHLQKTPEQQLEELRLLLIRPDDIIDRVSPQKRREMQDELVTTEIVVDRLSPHLVEVIEEQVTQAPDPFARSLAPIMGEAIRRQVYHSRDDIIDALYPVIGQMINRAVSEAMRDLARSIDERLKSAQPRNPFAAATSHVSEGEYQLRSAIPFEIREMFLIHRMTGILIAHNAGDARINDRDLVSGMLTAIRSFARDAFGQGNEELDTIAYESEQIIFEVGSAAYIAVVVHGVPPTNFRDDLQKLLIQMHASKYDELRLFDGSDTQLVKSMQSSMQGFIDDISRMGSTTSPTSTKLSRSQKIILSLIIIVLLLPLFGCAFWLWSVEARLRALAAQPTISIPSQVVASPTLLPTNTPLPTATAMPTHTPLPSPTLTIVPSQIPAPTPFATDARLIGNVYPHSLPSYSGSRLTEFLPIDSQVLVLEQRDEWYHIRLKVANPQGELLQGWVLKQWVALVDATIEVPTANLP